MSLCGIRGQITAGCRFPVSSVIFDRNKCILRKSQQMKQKKAGIAPVVDLPHENDRRNAGQSLRFFSCSERPFSLIIRRGLRSRGKTSARLGRKQANPEIVYVFTGFVH